MNKFASAATALLSTTAMIALSQTAHAQFSDDEIIVTATKRATSIQDVPIAVTAVSPVELERQGVTSIKDLSSVASGFNIQSSQTENQGTSIRIRGIGTTGNNIGLESAVGVFVDGVYKSRPGIALGEMVDLESLELLRGPQGTLFGRNTTAGALNIRTKAPDFEGTSGFANFTYGNYNMINVQGGVNMTASEDLAFRVTGSYHTRDGFMESTVVPGGESHDRDRYLIKAQALYEPTDQTSLRIIGEYQSSDENCCAAATLTTSPNLGPLVNSLFPAVGFEDSVDDYKFNSQLFKNGTDQKSISAELIHDFGDVEMTFVGAYNDFVGDNEQDDFNGLAQYTVVSDDTVETLTAELRFQGEEFDGMLDWMVGAFYADEKIEENQLFTMGTDFSQAVSQANFGSATALGAIAAAGTFLVNGNDPSIFATGVEDGGNNAVNKFNQEGTSLSIFTHNILTLSETVNLTLGARYIDDKKDGRFDQISVDNNYCSAGLPLLGAVTADFANGNTITLPNGAVVAATPFTALSPILGGATAGLLSSPAAVGPGAFLNCFPFIAPAIGDVTGIPFLPQEFDDSFDDSEFIYTAGLDWKPTDNILVYGSYSHGYKAGGFNLDATAAAGGNDPRFASEEIDTAEIGIKLTSDDRRYRLNLTGFHSTMDNFQVLEFTGSAFETFNVDDTSSKGFEVESSALLTDYIRANMGLTYADAGYGENCDRDGTIPQAARLCGATLTNAPKLSGVFGLTYDGPLGGSDWGFLANLNVATSSKRRTSTQPLTAALAPNPFDIQDPDTKINARVGFTMPNEQVSIEFWGQNLTNEITRGITFNTPLQGASRSAFLGAPRQYGATLRTKF